MASRKKIIIIEDQIILNDMLKKIISNNYDVVATSDDASNLITLCEKYNPDIVLTDICTKNNSNGIINGKKIKDKYGNKIKVLAMTGVPDITFLNETKKANLDGFIYKNISSELLINSIKQILNGYKLFPDNVTNNTETACLKKLTNKEFEILKEFDNIYFYDDNYYIDASNISDFIRYVEFGDIIYDENLNFEERGIKISKNSIKI